MHFRNFVNAEDHILTAAKRYVVPFAKCLGDYHVPRSLGHQDILLVGFVHSQYVISPFS